MSDWFEQQRDEHRREFEQFESKVNRQMVLGWVFATLVLVVFAGLVIFTVVRFS